MNDFGRKKDAKNHSSMINQCFGWLLLSLMLISTSAFGGARHAPASRFMSYEGLVMCGYQGWFRAPGDGSGEEWTHYSTDRTLDAQHLKVDLWPAIGEYTKRYPTAFKERDGTPACLFSSRDESTVELHFKWMREYGIDGVFMQRFFDVTRTEDSRRKGRIILEHALQSSQKYGRALAVMYDLSGIHRDEDCSSIIQDWKELVDTLKITDQGTNQTYLYHHGKPLVAIWGLGFPDRPYNLHDIGIEKLIDFLKHDPEYGGCSVMLGVPTHFRSLDADCVPDPYLHQVMALADIILPWMVGRFTPADLPDGYSAEVKRDVAWCAARKLDYAPCIYPGFSWYNLSRQEFGRADPLNKIPRLGGQFYWSQMVAAMESGAKMIYVAMFDEIDEGTAIFKCADTPPLLDSPGKLLGYGEVPEDHYLWLTGQAARMLRHQIPLDKKLYLKRRQELQARSQP